MELGNGGWVDVLYAFCGTATESGSTIHMCNLWGVTIKSFLGSN
jgi:hypothetical protein